MNITRRKMVGFTLVELLVAFAIMGFAMALVPMAYSKLNQAIEYRASIRDFITQVADARLKAMTIGRSAAVRVNLSNKTYGIDGQLNQKWPASYEIQATVADQEIQAGKIASIRFYPDGSSTGGSITVLRAPGVGVRFRIDWLTGRMTQESPNVE
ncbi:MAG: prepilin-type N-terminal cleavage/methylation domain-containing protein [Halothiobacillus sp.]